MKKLENHWVGLQEILYGTTSATTLRDKLISHKSNENRWGINWTQNILNNIWKSENVRTTTAKLFCDWVFHEPYFL